VHGRYNPYQFRNEGMTLIYRRTKNLRAVQFAAGSYQTGLYLGIEVDVALEMAEQTEA
jgi:hypothetical protein